MLKPRPTTIGRNKLIITPPTGFVLFWMMKHIHTINLLMYSCPPLSVGMYVNMHRCNGLFLKLPVVVFMGLAKLVWLIEYNAGDRLKSRNLRHPRVRFQSYPRVSEISRSWPVIGVWLFFLHRHTRNFFFTLCVEILLGCVLFGHISWNEYMWQWTSTSPFHRPIWLVKFPWPTFDRITTINEIIRTMWKKHQITNASNCNSI